ncbi:PAS domain-containing protein [Paraburkholderia sp. JHI2823]|uniref:methyl-accepting chemotaxis protein n=1 Tax=Paraburkholderia sp. JHI2823 TaxID=3112960 RepID=UPI00317EE7A7
MMPLTQEKPAGSGGNRPVSCELVLAADELSILKSITANFTGFLYRCLNDKNYTLIYATQGIQKLAGYPVADFIGNRNRTLASLIDSDDEEYVSNSIESAIRQKQTWTVDYRIHRADRQSVWVREVGKGVFDAEGKLRFLEGLVIEVEGERAAQLAAEKRLVATNLAVSAILSNVEEILKTIRALSILSFNARVEAARAGDSGRGFAIVAAEIKRLADDSDKLVKQVSENIRNVRQLMS